MKTTFLLGLPRCGSLALAVMNNNDYCTAHHEGLDFNCKASAAYDETSSSMLLEQSRKKGKNYFCCDISLGPQLMDKFIESRKQLGRDPYGEMQIVHVDINPDQSTESYAELFGLDEIERKAVHAINTSLHRQLTDRLYRMSNDHMVPTLKIEYKRGFFYDFEVADVAKFVGSWSNDLISNSRIGYLSGCKFTASRNLIMYGAKMMRKNGWVA